MQRVIMFHELAHILFDHPLTEVAGVGGLRGYMVSDADDAVAEAFAVGAMQYSFLEVDAPLQRTDVEDDVSTSTFGQPFPAKAYAIENKRLVPSGFRKHKVNRINNICILCH